MGVIVIQKRYFLKLTVIEVIVMPDNMTMIYVVLGKFWVERKFIRRCCSIAAA